MNLNRKILYIGLGLILIFMVASIGFSIYTKLEAPVFLTNCIEVPIPNQEDIPNSQVLFDLHYITNSTDKNIIVGINFPTGNELFSNRKFISVVY